MSVSWCWLGVSSTYIIPEARVRQDTTIGGNQMKSTWDLSVLFLRLPVSLYLLQNKKFQKWHDQVSTCPAVARLS